MKSKNLLWRYILVLLLFPITGQAASGTDTVADDAYMSSAEGVSVNESMKWALEYSPRLKTLQHNRDALHYELSQVKGDRLPSLDLFSSYGLDEHSDLATRQPDADPSYDEWEKRGEVALVLRQLLYDGGMVSSRIGIQQAKLNSAEYRVKDNAESIALDAVIAHLTVCRQTRLVTLAENNISDHEEILANLIKRQKGGAGNSADVTQAQGRLSRAKASLFKLKADLTASLSYYERVVGRPPGKLDFATIPDITPVELNEALALSLEGNPKILAFGVDVTQFESQLELADAAYYPKFFLELSKNYQNQIEGDPSWQDTNVAMVKMDWNLFNGGSDRAGKQAARSRVMQSTEILQNKILEVTEETQSIWAQYTSIIERIKAYTDATAYNRMTLDAYLQQFDMAQRSLLDVLDAENELFQSAGLLVTEQINELIAAGRILALGGVLVEAVFPSVNLSTLTHQNIKVSQPIVVSNKILDGRYNGRGVEMALSSLQN